MNTLRSLAVLALLSSVPLNVLAAPGDIVPEKRAAIEQLLDTTGALQLGQQLSSAMVRQLADSLREAHANVPQKALDVLPDVVNGVIAENLGTFKEVMIRIYDEHFTLQDVQGLNTFYSSELGHKVIKVLPGVLQESIAAGQQWGQAMGPEIARRLQARFRKEGIAL